MRINKPLWPRLAAFLFFLLGVNLLSGYIALALGYPSLWNVAPSFSEYALPLPFTWALMHWPSMLLYGIPLLYLTRERQRVTTYYRLFCVISFCLLLVQLDERIPFLLFPKVDAAIGLILSLVLVPPNRVANPVLFPMVCVAVLAALLAAIFTGFSLWRHRTPQLTTTNYAGGIFRLTAIEVDKTFREMRMMVELRKQLEVKEACELGQQMALKLLQDYPFDPVYARRIEVRFNPAGSDLHESADLSYPLGEISLNKADRDADGSFPCYLRYKE
jgi:hypothetical protein